MPEYLFVSGVGDAKRGTTRLRVLVMALFEIGAVMWSYCEASVMRVGFWCCPIGGRVQIGDVFSGCRESATEFEFRLLAGSRHNGSGAWCLLTGMT
jgi:hypothetical protein